MKVLPKKTCLGALRITEIYDYFDGPKLFCARNNTNQAYLVYWCDSSPENIFDGWLYLPVSEKRLECIRRGLCSIRQAFDDAEEGIYKSYVFYAPGAIDTTEYLHIDSIDEDFLPDADFFIDQSSITFVDKNEVEWNHDVRILKEGNKSNPSAESVSAIIAAWTSLLESAMNFISKSQRLYAVFAVPGSFEVKFNTPNNDVAYESLSRIISLISDHSLEDERLVASLYSIGIEVSDLKDIFDAMQYYGIEIDISPKVFIGDSQSCYLDKKTVQHWLTKLEDINGCVLSTSKIPQADELDNVMKYLVLRQASIEVTEDSFGLVDRQIRYYKDAAVLLGYLTKNSSLTSQGRYLLERDNHEERLRLIASSFRSTDCAMAWRKWAGKETIAEVEPESSVQFIRDSVPGLSEKTAGRRAKTLTRWLRDLKQYF